MTHHPLRPTGPTRARARVAAAVLAAVTALATLGPQAVQAAPLDDMRQQVDSGQFEQAYQTGVANPQLLGDVHFDFLFGIAAISTGRVPEGVLALERHLSAVPANDRARLELGRGYFLLGEFGRARAEFEFVLRNSPSPGLRATIETFLAQMQSRESVDARPIARLYAEVGAGHDNNVNGGTFNSGFNSAFGFAEILDRRSRQISDDFAQVTLGGQKSTRATNRLAVFGGWDIDHRQNFKERDFDLTSATGYIAFTQLAGPALWRTQLSANVLLLGGNRYRDAILVSVEPTYTLGADLALTPQASYTDQRFTGIDALRDARVTSLGGSAAWNPSGVPWAPSFNARLSWSQEDNYARRRDLDKTKGLVRATASVMPWQGIRIAFGGIAFQDQYGAEDPGFGSTRRDNVYGIDAVLSWAIDKTWSVRTEANWTVTRSNQDLYDSSRKVLALKLRYQY